MQSTVASFKNQSDLILVLGMICILTVLFTPIPYPLLDFLLICNFSFALLIMLLSVYVDKPIQFSTFPSILLIATLFRLALNISATRLILGDADAGRVIEAIGNYVVGGNYVIGLIVFLVLIVVQYVVVTNGAQRVAEVAARFTLDAMPGKQMSIDADLNMGLIDEAEARDRRKEIEKEANFYGAMDGASKFVKGDAIAGIIIIFIDIIGGLTIGIAQQGMQWDDALHQYTLLTVGDGIVTQIPALVIATGTGLIVTRAASDEFLSKAITSQIISHPKTLFLIGFVLLVFMFLPGIPIVPTLIVFIIVAATVYFALKAKKRNSQESIADAKEDETQDLYEMLHIDPIEIAVGNDLIYLVGGEDSLLMERIVGFRKQFAMENGFVIPKIRVKDNKKIPSHGYQVSVHGAKAGSGEIYPEKVLAINPGQAKELKEKITTKDPTYGLPAYWINKDERTAADDSGYTVVDPITVLVTHVTEIIRQDASNLLSRAETERLVGTVRKSDSGLVDELVPTIMSYTEIQKVLQHLLKEKVSIRNLIQILEVLLDNGANEKDPARLTELVRMKLGPIICEGLANSSGELYVLVLDPTIEQTIAQGVKRVQDKESLSLEPQFAEQVLSKLTSQVEKMMRSSKIPVLLCAPELRQHIRKLTERVMPQLFILSMSEVPTNTPVKSYGMVVI
ncbi:MAG: flagellar biosynthesis protein FlhA [Candidatus Thiodiazotropha sp. (ex Dulcina madagascariensis)]|nr:flagellar biosynthesis protein FlhA [Candidatus Thiodiazotropha sp. (ex Dulcina madagascariensis)]